MQASKLNKIRKGVAQALFYGGFSLVLACTGLAVIGGGIYVAIILLTEGRDGFLIPATQRFGPLATFVVLALGVAFLLGMVLAWLGGRISPDPGDRISFLSLRELRHDYRDYLGMVRLGGVAFAFFFVALWVTLRLDFAQAFFGGLLLLAGCFTLFVKAVFGDLSDRKSTLLVKNRHLSESQGWFCGECNKCFLPTHWLVAASSSLSPRYVAQCPQCRGGNTRPATEQQEKECEWRWGKSLD